MIILASGGMDSLALTALLNKKNVPLHLLVIDYGQATARKERNVVLEWPKLFENIATVSPRKLMLHQLADQFTINNDPNMVTPWRNYNLIGQALIAAHHFESNTIALGVHEQDYEGYVDCRPIFYEKLNGVLAIGDRKPVQLYVPFIMMNKKQIIKIGLENNVDFSKSWSCYYQEQEPCLECASCKGRIKAFEELGLKDPLL